MLRIAISNESPAVNLISKTLIEAGLDINFDTSLTETLSAQRFPAEVKFMSNQQILSSFDVGMQDIAIIETHILDEYEKDFEVLYTFENTSSALSVFIPYSMKYKNVKMFLSSVIATNTPNTVRKFMRGQKIRSVNILEDKNPRNIVDMGLADFFVDINSRVSTKQYVAAEQISETKLAVVINPSIRKEKRAVFVDEFIFRVESVMKAQSKIKVEFMCDEQYKNRVAESLGMIDENMLILSTFNKNKIIIQMVIDERQLWDIQHYLKQLNVDRILVQDISKIIV